MIDQITAIFSAAHAQVFDPERLPVAVCALMLVIGAGLLFGPAGGNANPIFWRTVDFLFGPLASRLDKTERNARDLATRGLIVTITAMIMAAMVGVFWQTLSEHVPNWRIVDIIALSFLLAAGAGWRAMARLRAAIGGKDGVKGAFYALALTSRTNLASSDEFTITRAAIGMGAKLFDKGVVAPILWYLIAGLPGAYLYAALAALSWRFGKEGFTKGFGATALALERLMGLIPNLFSGLMLALAGLLTPTAGMTRSFLGLIAGGGRAGYHEGGAPVTALAHALKVSLGGPTQDLDGSAIQRGWAGPQGATARLEAAHLKRGIYILVMAHLLFIAALLVGIVLGGRI
jgi:adenosylcobinamide-phosphate synthase